MKSIENISHSEKAKVVTLIFIFVLVLLMNLFTIWAADDYANYNSVWQQGDSFNIEKPFVSAKNAYFSITGRFISTFINHILLFFNKNIFNVLNSFAYTFLVYLIYNIVKTKENIFLLIIIFVATWFFIPALGQVMFWQIGSVIYLWMLTIGMIVISIYINLAKGKREIKDNLINNFTLFLFAIVVGNGLETNSIMFIVFLSSFFLYHKIKGKNKLPKWTISSFIGLIIGTLTNFIAPGNYARYSTQQRISDSLFNSLYYGIGLWFYRGIISSGVYILLILLFLLIIGYLISAHTAIKKYLSVSVILSFLCMIGSGIALLIFVLKVTKPTVQEFLDWYWLHADKFNLCVFILLVLFFATLLLFVIFRKKIFIKTQYDNFEIVIFLLLSACVGIASYIVTPFAWERSYMGMCVFLTIAIIYLLNRINLPKKGLFLIKIFSILIIGIFCVSYKNALTDTIRAKKWEKETALIINEKIANNEEKILVKTFMSTNTKNAASVEKWVIPAIIDYEPKTKDNIHAYYEWINIAITNYYFKDRRAWAEGKRILGYE